MTKCYIAIGPHCWGKAFSIEQAIANAKKAWPRMWRDKWVYNCFECHPDTVVTEPCGDLSYPKGHTPRLVKSNIPANMPVDE